MSQTYPQWTRADRVALAVALVVSLAFVVPVLYRGWVPFDEGWIIEQATRVLAGQLPHRDFDDLWTGGWSFVHAALLRLFGPSMAIMRSAILVAWTAGLVALFAIVRRRHDPVLAGASVIVSALWTLWAWQLPLLNWFYFPGALLAVLAVMRFEETGRHRWLVAAGTLAGILFVFKLTGLFLLSALLLWSVVRAAHDGQANDARDAPRSAIADARWAALVPCALHATLSVRLASGMPGAESAVVLIAGPNVVLAAGLAVVVWRGGPLPWMRFIASMLRIGAPVVLGFALPVLALLAPYLASGSIGALWHGVFVTPLRRLADVAFPPPWWRIAAKLSGPALLLWLGVPRTRGGDGATWPAVALGAVLGTTYVLLPASREYLIPTLATLPLVIATAWAWTSVARTRDGTALLLVSVAASAQLLQVPFATVNYFLASAPLLVAASLFLPTRGPRRTATLFAFAALGVAGACGVRRLPPLNAEIRLDGDARMPHGDAIWIPRDDSIRYAEVTRRIAAHLGGGGLYVFPWHNEFYYFTGTRNPVRSLTALLAPDAEIDPAVLVPRLDAARTTVVVLFPPTHDEWIPRLRNTVRAIREKWSCSERLHGWAEVRWRPSTETSCQ